MSPSSPATRAWGDPPLTLVCGGAAPKRLSDEVTLTVDGIPWSSPDPTGSRALWRTRDASVPYVEMILPIGVQPASALGAVVDAWRASAKP